MDKYITTPITAEVAEGLHAGDYVYLSGTVYVARDAAHKRLAEALDKAEGASVEGLREVLPFPIEDAAIYYMVI